MGFIHSEYGFFMPGWRDIKGYEGQYKVNEKSEILSVKRNSILKPARDHVWLCLKNVKTQVLNYKLALEAFFPSENFYKNPNDGTIMTIDHKNNDYTDNHLCNLQYLSLSENVRKSAYSGLKKSPAQQMSKPILVLDKNNTIVKEFGSMGDCVKELKYCNKTIRKMIENKAIFADGCILQYKTFENEKDEEWKTSDALQEICDAPDVWCSNKGRFKKGAFPPTRGIPTRNKNSRINQNNHNYSMHQLIYAAFTNKMPPKYGDKNADGVPIFLNHDTSAPLTENGLFRNHPSDISIGTQSDNQKKIMAIKAKQQ